MYTYDTVVEAINGLRTRGYILDFNIAANQLVCHEKNICLDPEDFEIVEMHRFEGDTNPSDEDVVFAVESKSSQVKGIVTSAFGSYADPVSTELLKKLTLHHK